MFIPLSHRPIKMSLIHLFTHPVVINLFLHLEVNSCFVNHSQLFVLLLLFIKCSLNPEERKLKDHNFLTNIQVGIKTVIKTYNLTWSIFWRNTGVCKLHKFCFLKLQLVNIS